MAVDQFHAMVSDSEAIGRILLKIKLRELVYKDNQEFYSFNDKKIDELTYSLTYYPDSKKSYLFINGSLHKFYNSVKYNKGQNFDDFTYTQQCDALRLLSKEIDCPLEYLKIKSFEFGINIRCGSPANVLINQMYYYDRRVKPTDKHFYSGLQKTFNRDSYLFKIYNKAQESEFYKHGTLAKINDLIRLEIKYKDRAYCLKDGKIENLGDFENIKKVEELYTQLQKHWKKILMYNSTQLPPTIERKDVKWFNKCSVNDYFNDPNKINFKDINQTRINHYERFVNILDNHNYRSNYIDLTGIIKSKCIFLIQDNNALVETLMDIIYTEVTKTKIMAKSVLIEKIKELLSLDIMDEKNCSIFEQAILRLFNAGHIKELQSYNTKYCLI